MSQFNNGAALANLGNAERSLGELEAAIEHMGAGIALRRPIQDPRDFVDDLADLALTYAAAAGEIRPGTDAYGFLFAIGNLCAGAGVDGDARYDARRMVGLLVAGLRQPNLGSAPMA